MKLLLGDCLDKLKGLDDNSIDSIVTDPPYGLSAAPNSGKKSKGGFMGKKWDYDVPSVEIWKECMRVLKPGGHLLAFAGSRTYHRMAVRIEDAGFEIRDQIMWIYGCLSEDTEILTKEGWKHYHKITKDDIYSKEEILVYDTERDIYKWEKPERWYVYPLNQDTLYRIRGNQTDQLVSKDHNCIVERDGKLVFIKSQDLSDMERMPILSNDFSFLQEEQIKVLQLPMQRKSSRRRVERMGNYWRGNIQSTRKQKKKSQLRRKEWGLERWNNLQKQEGLLFQSKNKVCKMSEGISTNVKKGWLCNGISSKSGYGTQTAFIENGVRSSHRPQSRKQRYLKSNVIQEQLGSQEIRSRSSYTTDLATITKETYSGIIFCPNTSTGAFVARRNGKVFITGNSGFPKSMDISKQIDKRVGAEREVIGSRVDAFGDADLSETDDGRNLWGKPSTTEINVYSKEAVSDLAKQWNGWGTALKPAHEPIVMARKPLSEKTVVDNVLEWGTGGINIDDSRISTDDNLGGGATKGSVLDIEGFDRPWMHDEAKIKEFGDKMKEKVKHAETLGRFPANVIFDEEAGKILDEQSGISKSTGGRSGNKEGIGLNGIYGDYKGIVTDENPGFGDIGGASRFFYCPKTSKRDRNEGLDGFELKQQDLSRKEGNPGGNNPRNRGVTKRQNHHPTVKPTDLMLYLIRLVTPKGGTTLDPFMGSGSTGKAAVRGGFDFIGIEREEAYFEIAQARIQYEHDNPYNEENGKRVEMNKNSHKFF